VLRTGKVDFFIAAESLDSALAALKAFEPGEFASWYWKSGGFEERLQAAETVGDFLRLLGWTSSTSFAGAIDDVGFDPGPSDADIFQLETQDAFERLGPYVAPNCFVEYKIMAEDVGDEISYYRWFFDGTKLIDQTGVSTIVYE
jgi:hypothetical protein